MIDLNIETHTAELLEPLERGIEVVRTLVTLAAVAVILVVAGAKLERFLLKRKLEVIDGEGDAGGDRS